MVDGCLCAIMAWDLCSMYFEGAVARIERLEAFINYVNITRNNETEA